LAANQDQLVTQPAPAAYKEAVLALLVSLLAAGALAAPSPPSRTLVAGPAFAGERVVWGEQHDGLNVLRAWPDSSSLWQSATSWFAGPLAGSATLVAFSRSYEGCPGQPGVACPVETQTLVGPPHGSLRPVGPATHCMSAGPGSSLAVSGALVAFVEPDCTGSGASLSVRKGRRTLFERSGVSCCDVSLAGSYVAWRSGSSVDLLDLRTHRLAYRADAPAGEQIAAVDLQADVKLALLLAPAGDGRTILAWRTAGAATLHRLRLRGALPASGAVLHLTSDRILTQSVPPGSASELLVADLRGRVRVLARFAAPIEHSGAIDAAGTRATWASRRITGTRTECPPPGQERPCRLLKSGVETVWLASLNAGTPRAIARWAFTDVP
jgi:hypothetical protein